MLRLQDYRALIDLDEVFTAPPPCAPDELEENPAALDLVVFDVFADADRLVYERLLSQ